MNRKRKDPGLFYPTDLLPDDEIITKYDTYTVRSVGKVSHGKVHVSIVQHCIKKPSDPRCPGQEQDIRYGENGGYTVPYLNEPLLFTALLNDAILPEGEIMGGFGGGIEIYSIWRDGCEILPSQELLAMFPAYFEERYYKLKQEGVI
jgi:hypothetical protein